jgi:hypothetical protein
VRERARVLGALGAARRAADDHPRNATPSGIRGKRYRLQVGSAVDGLRLIIRGAIRTSAYPLQSPPTLGARRYRAV